MTDRTRQRDLVYRLMTPDDLSAARASGDVPMRDIDRADGYFHLSAETQLIETANLHFNGLDLLYALGFQAEGLTRALKWELAPKRGEEFPHYYAEALPLAAADRLLRLDRRPGGSFAVTSMDAL